MRLHNNCQTRIILAVALVSALLFSTAHARSGSASGYRGSASWGGGSGSASSTRGGSASWNAGSGGSATTANGGSASWGGGTATATTANGSTATRSGPYYGRPPAAYGAPGYRPPAAVYHPPAAVYRPPAAVYHPVPYGSANVYYNNGYNATTGQVVAAGVAGMAVGAMAGSAAAKSSKQSTYATQASAPSSVAQPPVIDSPLPVGSQLSALPAGCTNAVVKSVQYYGCGPNWFKPAFGNNGVYYQVVNQPF